MAELQMHCVMLEGSVSDELSLSVSQTVSPKLELSVSALVIRRSLAVLLFFFTWHR